MPAPNPAPNALADAQNIEVVWSKNTSMTLGSDTDPDNPKVTHADFLAVKTKVEGYDKSISDLRTELDDLLNKRNDSAKVLVGLNTHALSAIRGIFGPNSSEYEQAGGTRSSERKKPGPKKPTPPAP